MSKEKSGRKKPGMDMKARAYGHGAKPRQQWFSHAVVNGCDDRFGYMFPGLARRRGCVLRFGATNRKKLEELGMIIGSKDSGNQDNPAIAAGYTYLGQFIDHDVTLDPLSDFSKPQDPNNTLNFRTPCFDLDSVYGRGPALDPHLYDQSTGDPRTDGLKLKLGVNQAAGNGGPDSSTNPPADFDVPRSQGPDFTALLGDPRNDENLIVSQLHHGFLKFHNQVIDELKDQIGPNKDLFAEARQTVRHHYQWIVMHDFLKTMVGNDALVDDRLANGARFFRRRPFRMPVEFAVAAYRFGHSMVRNRYKLNDALPEQSLMAVFQFVRVPRLPVLSNWAIDFNRFFDTGSGLPVNQTRLIDTRLAAGLEKLPGQPAGIFASLAARNLVRGLSFGVPSGQCVAKRLGIKPLTPQQIGQDATPEEEALLKGNLLKRTPLWYYVLKEAEVLRGGHHLGPVGGMIVTETFARMLHDDPDSFIQIPGWTPTLPATRSGLSNDFKFIDLLDKAGIL